MSDLFMRRVISLFIGVPVFHYESRFGIDFHVGLFAQRAGAEYSRKKKKQKKKPINWQELAISAVIDLIIGTILIIIGKYIG